MNLSTLDNKTKEREQIKFGLDKKKIRYSIKVQDGIEHPFGNKLNLAF